MHRHSHLRMLEVCVCVCVCVCVQNMSACEQGKAHSQALNLGCGTRRVCGCLNEHAFACGCKVALKQHLLQADRLCAGRVRRRTVRTHTRARAGGGHR
jgi:hypothetical protein